MAIIFKNIANIITIIGIFLTVCLNLIIWNGLFHQQLIIFLVIGIALSDLLDGWTARSLNISSKIGEFLDKFRDRLFSCSIFIYFFIELWYWNEGFMILVLVLVIESVLVLVWIFGLDNSSHISRKIKISFYFIAIGWWLIGQNLDVFYLGLIILLFASSIYGVSTFIYFRRN